MSHGRVIKECNPNPTNANVRHFQTAPIAIPIPDHLILFSPHHDDIAISMGALAAWAAPRVPVTIVLMTDGSEAQLPEHVLQAHIHHPKYSPQARFSTTSGECL
jgi:hypothetical protein